MFCSALVFRILDVAGVSMERFPIESEGAVDGWGGSPQK